MLKVTLDTNVIIDENLVTQFKHLEKQGLIDIAVSTRVVADKFQDRDKVRKSKHLKEFESYPKEAAPARWDFSIWDSGDFWAGEEDINLSQQLEELVFGEISGKRSHNKLADIDHLLSHYQGKRDIFVTRDNGIWRKRVGLKDKLGIVVENPQEFLSRFNVQI